MKVKQNFQFLTVNSQLAKRGEGYIDVVIGIFALMMVLVISLNIFSLMTLRQDMDVICGQLIETAVYEGAFDDEFDERTDELKTRYFNFGVSASAEEYYNAVYKRVQLGDTMSVTVSAETYVKGLGAFRIPLTVSVTRSGISERYRK